MAFRVHAIALALACLTGSFHGRRAQSKLQGQPTERWLAKQLRAYRDPAAAWQVIGHNPAVGPQIAGLSAGKLPLLARSADHSMQLHEAFDDEHPSAASNAIEAFKSLAIPRRTVLSLAGLLLLPTQRAEAKGDYYTVTIDGVTKEVTLPEAKKLALEKAEKLKAEGKSLPVERRGPANEKALYERDFYYKYQVRPYPQTLMNAPVLPFTNPQAEMPFALRPQKVQGLEAYQERIQKRIDIYGNLLKEAISTGNFTDVSFILRKGDKRKGVKEGKLLTLALSMGALGPRLLSDIDEGDDENDVNLINRYFVNEVQIAIEDIAAAAAKKDIEACKAAWALGAECLNAYVKIINVAVPEGEKPFTGVQEGFA